MVEIPDAPPPTILFGVKKEPIAKPVIIVPNMVNKKLFDFFMFICKYK